MSKFEQDVIDRLARIETNLKNLKQDIADENKILNGNGQPGLITRVTQLETNQKAKENHAGLIAGIIAWIVNAAIAVYAALKNQ